MVRKSTVFLCSCILASIVYVFVLDTVPVRDSTGYKQLESIKSKFLNSMRNFPGLNTNLKSHSALLSVKQDILVDTNTPALIRQSTLKFNLSAETKDIVKEKVTIRLTGKGTLADADQPNILNLARSLQNVQEVKEISQNENSDNNRGKYRNISGGKVKIPPDVGQARETKPTATRKWSNKKTNTNMVKNTETNGQVDSKQMNGNQKYISTLGPKLQVGKSGHPFKKGSKLQPGVPAPRVDIKDIPSHSVQKERQKLVPPKGMPVDGKYSTYIRSKSESRSEKTQMDRNQRKRWVNATRNTPLPLKASPLSSTAGSTTKPTLAPASTAVPFHSYHIDKDKKLALAELFKDFHENDTSYEKYELNATLSHSLSLDRAILDTRPEGCKHIVYPDMKKLTVSVIIPFFEEDYSVLLRLVHSIFNRTPKELLTEIILIDDCSTLESLKEPLKHYVDALRKLKLFHMPKREGLIRARMMGARAAKGNVLVFLDAHVECNEGWLQPILREIYFDRTTVALPSIDYIKPTTFHYNSPSRLEHGTFTWKLDFIWKDIKGRVGDLTNTHPFASATMVGCSFAVERNYFFEMGAYDEGMYIWGGENLEMSFRTWMCGGSMKIVPCSRVGHVFRTYIPYDIISKNIVHKNLQRVADVWMDDYKKYFYGTTAKHLPMSNLDKATLRRRVQLRRQLHCRPFKWYMDNIVPGLITPPADAVVHGQLKNVGSDQCAVYNVTANRIQFVHCGKQSDDQIFYYNNKDQIVHSGECLRYQNHDIMRVVLAKCNHRDRQQLWTYFSHIEEDIKESLKGFDYYKPMGSFRLKYSKKMLSLYQIIDTDDGSTTGLLATNRRSRFQYWLFTDQFLYRKNVTDRY